MTDYTQTIVTDASGVMTGWASGDPNRFVELATGVEVDPVIWELWDLEGAGHWRLGGSLVTLSPDDVAHDNAPWLQVQFDDVGVWINAATLFTGHTFTFTIFSTGRPASPSTMSFRTANINDDIGGIFTPRSFDGLEVTLVGDSAFGPAALYTQARVSFGVMLYTAPVRASGGRRRSRSYAAVIG